MGDPSYLRYVPPSVANVPIDWSRVPEASKEHLLLWAYDWKKQENRPLPETIADLAKWFDKSKFFGYFEPKLCTAIMDISEFGLKAVMPKDLGIPVGPRFYMKYLEQVWYLLFSPGDRDCMVGYSHDIITEEEEDENTDDGEYKEEVDDEDENMDEDDDEDMESDDEEDKEDEVTQDEADKEVKGLVEEEKEQKEKVKGDEEGDEDKHDKGPYQEEEKDDEKDMEDQADEDEDDEEPGAAKEVVLAQEFDVVLEQDVSRGNAIFVIAGGSKKLAGWSASTLNDSLRVAQYAQAMMTLPTSHPAFSTFMSTMLRRY